MGAEVGRSRADIHKVEPGLRLRRPDGQALLPYLLFLKRMAWHPQVMSAKGSRAT